MSQAPESLKVFAKLFLVVSVIFTVIMYFLSIALDPFLFYFTPEGLASSINNLPNLPVWLFTFSIKLPIILDVGTIFLGLWTIFSLCFIAAWKINENFHTTIKESTNRPVAKLFQQQPLCFAPDKQHDPNRRCYTSKPTRNRRNPNRNLSNNWKQFPQPIRPVTCRSLRRNRLPNSPHRHLPDSLHVLDSKKNSNIVASTESEAILCFNPVS